MLGIEGTCYLAFRDIPKLLQKYAIGKRALDYGCGAGRSTRFLKSLGFDAIGVDISLDMLRQARAKDEQGGYYHIRSGNVPFGRASFDVVFSSFVLLEISSRDEMGNVLSEMTRVVKSDGCIIIVTAPPDAYKSKWVSFSYDFPENRKVFRSGDMVKLLIRGTNVVLYDYYWTEDDYAKAFEAAGLVIREIHKPLGRADDPVPGLDELKTSPTLIYVLAKDRN